ncbi:DENN domain-containing protein 10-like [Ruditapes philippinarum]|uniref:DENN domain-containing protein 10-like n=1 Tax=Ruditapes philippinarum TaxID=129788 RepID=UPI00295B25C9|nr:DENN domain-containing protein 10-like [Ruditapes philippinarum]
MAALCDLVSAGLIEKDTNNDVLWTWSYPMVTEAQRALFTRKCCLSQSSEHIVDFLYSQLGRQWYYIYTHKVEDRDNLPKVTAFSVILLSKDFNPEKYEALCQILCQRYCKTGSPTSILEVYLAVVTKGKCNSEENGKFSTQDYQIKHAYANSNLAGVIEMFGVETILIYTALLLKKRIAVYFPPHSIKDLLQFTRSLPAFIWHRQNWNIVHPYVELIEEEIDQLKTNTHYVAGFTDATIESRSDLYDVFVNGTAGQISVAPHAKDALAMGKLHKDIAMFMVKLIEDTDINQQQVIKDVATKTKELLNNLKSLAGEDGTIALESLKERKMPPATENFLFNLAACEGLVQM